LPLLSYDLEWTFKQGLHHRIQTIIQTIQRNTARDEAKYVLTKAKTS